MLSLNGKLSVSQRDGKGSLLTKMVLLDESLLCGVLNVRVVLEMLLGLTPRGAITIFVTHVQLLHITGH